MGFVIRESIKTSITSYIGFIIGMVNVILLSARFLTPEQLGLTRVLQESTLLFVSIAQVGAPFIIIRFFAHYREEASQNKGILFFMLLYSLIGFFFFSVLFFLFKNVYIDVYSQKSPLLVEYLSYVIPFVFGSLMINLFEAYLIVHSKVFLPVFIREVFIKLCNTAVILLYAFNIISFNGVINLLVLSYLAAVIILVLYVYKIRELKLRPNLILKEKQYFKPIFAYGIFTLIGGISFLLATRIDTIIIPAFQGLKQTAVYSIALLIATLMDVPKRNLTQAALPSLTKALKEENLEMIKDIYRKTSLNLTIFGFLIVLLIYTNIDDIFRIMPKGDIYISGKNIVYIFLLSKLWDLFSGTNNEIILYSKYYKFSLLFIIFLAIFTIAANLILIPIYGILGAALAALLTTFLYLSLKIIIIWVKFKSHPFTLNVLKSLGLFLGLFVLFSVFDFSWKLLYPGNTISNHFYIFGIIAFKSMLITTLFTFIYFRAKVSEEFNSIITHIIFRVRNIIHI